jgi:cathepsin L
MKVALVLLACVAFASALHTEAEYQSLFTNFVVKFGKSYDVTELFNRFRIFKNNVDLIDQHNEEAAKGKWTFTLGVNNLADYTNEEYQQLLGFRSSKSVSGAAVHSHRAKGIPASFDWRTKGAVTPVQDQGQCGSCWAFSAIAAMEGGFFQQSKKLLKFSEQMCVDCVNNGADTCDLGGEMHDCYLQVIAQGGNMLESDYPYTATSGNPCGFDKTKAVGNVFTGYVNVTVGDENALQASSAASVVSVGIDASSFLFQLYSSGVYNDPSCHNDAADLDHGVTVVGYGHDAPSGLDYWIVKNSWGAYWGQSGYIWMSRNNKNQCGIATDATVPTFSS